LKRYFLATLFLCAGVVSGCKEKSATAPDLGFIKVNPQTVEILIPFEDFVDDVQVFGGYGSAADLGHGVVSLDYNGLTTRSLVHVADYPTSVEVPGADGVVRADTDLSFVGGRVVFVFDTLVGSVLFPVDVELFDVTEEWHVPTVTWEMAVDTAGDQRAWSQPGGGPSTLLGAATFDAFSAQRRDDEEGLLDTVSIAIDSVAVARLGDPSSAMTGFLLAAAEPGLLLNVVGMKLVLTTVPSTRPDTIVEVQVPSEDLIFIFPSPPAPGGWLRVGGTPSWRSVLTMSIPQNVPGTPEICGAVGCQVDLTEATLNLAELILTTRETEFGFQPQDTMGIDIRQVLNPELLPKSPLGGQLVPSLEVLPPVYFSSQAGTTVLFGVTELVADVLLAADQTGTIPVTAISLFSVIEPQIVGFASFEGGGGTGAPALRLLYTFANPVGLP